MGLGNNSILSSTYLEIRTVTVIIPNGKYIYFLFMEIVIDNNTLCYIILSFAEFIDFNQVKGFPY